MTALTTRPGQLVLDNAGQDLLFRQAHTAAAFTDDPVSAQQISAIYDLVKYGPTDMNSNPLRITLTRRDSDARRRLIPLLHEPNRAKTQAAPLTAILAADQHFHEHLGVLFPVYEGARAFYEGSPEADALREWVAQNSAVLQAGYFIIGIRTAGLAAGPMGGFDRDGVDAEFFPEGRSRSFLVINLGVPRENLWPHRLPRLPEDTVITWA